MKTKQPEPGSKSFNFSEPVNLPETVKHRQVDDKHLFIAPYNPSWVVANGIGAVMLAPLKEGHTIGEAVHFAVQQLGISQQEAEEEMKTLLTEIEARGFYADAPERLINRTFEKPSLQLFLTRSCNIRCIHCYMDGGEPMADELGLEEWKGVIDTFTKVCGEGWMTLSGGEPMCREDMFEIARYGKEKGHHLYLLTNGTLIRDTAMAKRVAALFDDVQVSLDGASREVTDRIRGKGVFDKVVNAIQLLAQEKVSLKLAFTVFPDILKDMEENLIPLVLSFDYPIAINIDDTPTKMGRAADFPPESFRTALTARESLNKIMRSIWEKGWARRPTGVLNKPHRNCGIGNGFTVDANGDVYPCPMPVCKFGNLRKDNLEELAAKISQLGKETAVEKMEECTNCDLKYICVGGCRVWNYDEHGDFLVPTCTENSRMKLYYRMIDTWI